MGGNPEISVVMPMYKEPLQVLTRTVDSILSQTFHDLELIVVVDNPEYEDAIALLEAYAARDGRLRVELNPHNLGVWASYNRGIRRARGRFIAIQDADDYSYPDRLELQHKFLTDNPHIDVVGASLEYIDDRTKKVLMTRAFPGSVVSAIKRYCPIAHGTTLRRKGLHDRYGFYDESPAVRHAADYELWCRWQTSGAILSNISPVVYRYYQHSSSFKTQNVRSILRDTIAIKRRYARRLQFGIVDYLYLFAERIVARLPASLITILFYRYTRLRAALSQSKSKAMGS